MKNNRGFLLAESLVVSTFVLTVLILLYIQFSNLTTNYKNSYNYNNVESIYDLSSVSNYLLNKNYNLSNQLTDSKPYVVIYKDNSCNMDAGIIDTFCDNLINMMDAKTIIYTSSDISAIQKYVSEKEDSNINQKLREFISRVETNTVKNKGRLFAEFNNGTFATIAMDNEINIPEDPEDPNDFETANIGGEEVKLVESGDGLYKDTIESGRYIYKGTNPNNYIIFNNETWRIISKETDGSYKIIRNSVLSNQSVWNTTAINTWDNSTIENYLTTTYYNTLSSTAMGQIISHTWNVGAVESLSDNLESQISDEKSITWNGSVGLANASDYLRANSSSACTVFSGNNYYQCIGTNWMYLSNINWWTITPSTYNTRVSYYIHDTSGYIYYYNVSTIEHSIRPSVFLNSNIVLTGNGTQADPYKIG